MQDMVDLNFKVPRKVRKEFKMLAIRQGLPMKQAIIQCIEAWKEHVATGNIAPAPSNMRRPCPTPKARSSILRGLGWLRERLS
ncbi:MAG: hypothetical protein IH626_04650 [Rhodospirillales bacterium]|nr:hypothetical protein [Rhodospirillales bacterium]